MRIPKSILASFLLALAVTGCSSPRPSEDSVKQAVFRHLMQVNEKLPIADAFYLSMGDSPVDPTDEFIKRFQENKLPVKKVSQCTSDPISGVRDKITGKKGYILFVEDVRWIDRRTAELNGGWKYNGTAAAEWTFRVSWRRGQWVVEVVRLNWVA